MLKKIPTLAVLIFAILAIVYCWKTKSNEETRLDEKSIETSPINLKLSTKNPQLVEVSEKESLEIEKAIAIFEEYKYKKDFVRAIEMLTPPTNEEEKGWLDHLLGNDLIELNNDKPSPRFTNKVNFHLLIEYDIEKITKDGDIFYAYTKELRLLNVAEEGTNPKYKAEMQNLTFELLNKDNNYEISRYYHTNPSSIGNLKYEGFVAF